MVLCIIVKKSIVKGGRSIVDLLHGLNAVQREVVTHTEGFVRVIARAGSGKTRVLSQRFAYCSTSWASCPDASCVSSLPTNMIEIRKTIKEPDYYLDINIKGKSPAGSLDLAGDFL